VPSKEVLWYLHGGSATFLCGCAIRVEGSVFDRCTQAHSSGVAPKAPEEWLTLSGALLFTAVGVVGSI
jgi:hypothetical protein